MPDDVKKLNTGDLMDMVFGEIQSVVEAGRPQNVTFNYFLPPIPFGPELASFMRIGKKPKALGDKDQNGELIFDANDLARAAINFARIVDNVPTLDTDIVKTPTDDAGIVDLNALIASGVNISSLYKGILTNSKVINNKRSSDEEAELKKQRAKLYKEVPEKSAVPAEEADEELDELDLDAIFEDGADQADIVENPDELLQPTRMMLMYDALESRFDQINLMVLDRLDQMRPPFSPNDNKRRELLQKKIDAAKRKWEVQGSRSEVRNILGKIEQLSIAGMPEYISELRAKLEANKLSAALIANDEGMSLQGEEGYYAALRPNGILDAKSLMKIKINNNDISVKRRFKSSKTSGKVGGLIPISVPIFGSGKGSKSKKVSSSEFFKEGFELSFEIVQGIIDRPWLDVAFLESGAYTTVDPTSKKKLDEVNEITELSDGKNPPLKGSMRAIPQSIYFVRNLTLKSETIKTIAQSVTNKKDGSASLSIGMFFNSKVSHSATSTQSKWERAASTGEVTMDGTFVVAMASRFLKKAPNPNLEDRPNPEDWI